MRTYYPAATWEESCSATHNSEGGLTSLKQQWEVPWGPRCNSRRTQSFLPQLEKHHEIPASMWYEAWFPALESLLKSNPGLPPQSKGDLTSLSKHKRLPEIPRGNSRGTLIFPPQLEKNHEIPPSMWDEAFVPSNALREIPSSQSKHERRLDSLYTTQDIPWNTHCNLRGTP